MADSVAIMDSGKILLEGNMDCNAQNLDEITGDNDKLAQHNITLVGRTKKVNGMHPVAEPKTAISGTASGHVTLISDNGAAATHFINEISVTSITTASNADQKKMHNANIDPSSKVAVQIFYVEVDPIWARQKVKHVLHTTQEHDKLTA